VLKHCLRGTKIRGGKKKKKDKSIRGDLAQFRVGNGQGTKRVNQIKRYNPRGGTKGEPC